MKKILDNFSTAKSFKWAIVLSFNPPLTRRQS